MDQDLEIKKFMSAKLAEGVSLSHLQDMVNEKFGTRMTFMEIRILASELEDVDWAARDPQKPEPEKKAEKEEPPAAPAGATKVEMSKIMRPGALAEGTVVFKSGASAIWFVDQTGRLGLDQVKGEPSEEDFADFQTELQKLFSQR